MERTLIVSSTEKSIALFTELVNAAFSSQIVSVKTCGEARRLLLNSDFNLVIINAPLPDESGERLARHIAVKGIIQVVLVVKAEYYDAIAAICADDGVLTIAKPINRSLFWSTLKLAEAAQSRMRRLQNQNDQLTQKIEDIRLIDRAKCILIAYFQITEQEAHRFIEKQAMDRRITKRKVAEGILKTYEER